MNLRVAVSCCAALVVASGAHAADKAEKAAVDSVFLLAKAVAKDSTNYGSLYRLGVMYLDRDSLVKAVQVFRRAVKARPDAVPAMVNLGAALDALGLGNEAQEWYRKALEVSPTDSIAGCRLASSLYSVGKTAEAKELLAEIIRRSPRSHCAYFTLGVAFADAGIYRDAIRMWRKVIELDPGSPEALSAKESIEVLERYAPPPR